MNEPTGQPIDATPWEEARPPHLPDRLTRLSPWVVPFVLAALFHTLLVWREWSQLGPFADLSSLVSIAQIRLTAIVMSLLGAALFLRHPGARRATPLLVLAVILFAIEELLTVGSGALVEVFSRLNPPTGETLVEMPAAMAYLIPALVGVSAVVYTARGLSTARRFEGPGGVRAMVAVLIVLTFAGLAGSLASVGRGTFEPTAWSYLLIAIGAAISVLVTLAWSYVLVVALGGWLVREQARAGWGLMAIAAGLFVGIRFVIAFGGLFPAGFAPDNAILTVVAYASLLAPVLLLLAFAVGLPSTDAVADDRADLTVDPPAARLPGSATG